MTSPPVAPTAAMIAIGDEILSGRTKDKNIGQLAEMLTVAGIDLKEVRIIGDEPQFIADTLNTLRRVYDYVFTSGGIGPTHDDLTADAVGAAFGLEVGEHPQAMERPRHLTMPGETWSSPRPGDAWRARRSGRR